MLTAEIKEEEQCKMEKMYRVLLANHSEDFSSKLAGVLKKSDRYAVVGTANDGVRAIELLHQVRQIGRAHV